MGARSDNAGRLDQDVAPPTTQSSGGIPKTKFSNKRRSADPRDQQSNASEATKQPSSTKPHNASAPELHEESEEKDEDEDDAPVLTKKQTVRFGSDVSKEQVKKSNRVRTTKYTALTWFPLSLLFQFKRAANIYFLIISVLTCMPFSPKTPASMIGTFAMVLFFTQIKEAYEDIQRKRSDNEMNCRRTQVVNRQTGLLQSVQWADLHMGDIVKVEKDEEIPADLLLISAPKDVVFVSTMNLDGETNLKDRELCVTTITEAQLPDFKGQVVSDEANASLDLWDGNLSSASLGRLTSCSIKNLMLRGCTLKNTSHCYGICVYVGADTKIFMNSKKSPRKVSNLMKLMNKMLYSVFVA